LLSPSLHILLSILAVTLPLTLLPFLHTLSLSPYSRCHSHCHSVTLCTHPVIHSSSSEFSTLVSCLRMSTK
jgi:hypothetical protein